MQAEVAADIRMIFDAPDRPTADAYLVKTIATVLALADQGTKDLAS